MKYPKTLGVIAATLLLLPAALLADAPDAKSAPQRSSEPKTHTLFMGTTFFVDIGGRMCRISDVNGDSFVVTVDGQKTLIPMRGERHSLKVVPALKITESSASVTGFKCDRAYTPGNDPHMRRMIAANEASAAIGDNASLAEGKETKALNNGFVMATAPHLGPTAPTSADILAYNQQTQANNASYAQAFQNASAMAQAQEDSEIAGGAHGEELAQEDEAKKLYDAFEVNFTISSPVPLEKPYLFLIVNYRESDSKPDSVRKLIYAKALDPIGAKPEKIHLMQGGLPLGYVLESYQLHIYNEGTELASDVAPKRVALTRDDAFEYLTIEYLTAHKGATLPAVPAIGKPDPNVAAALTDHELSEVYYVKVSKNGLPMEAYLDQVCRIPVDTGIGSIVKNVRFYPALVDGKPVEGVARLVLKKLAI